MTSIEAVREESIRYRATKIKEAVRKNWFPYLFLTPLVAYLVFLLWIPFFRGVWMSFHNWPFFGAKEWVGLKNYEYIFTWDPFYTSLKATFYYLLITVIQLALALIASLSLANIDLSSRLDAVVNGIYLIPYTMPPVVTGALWILVLDPLYGPIFTPLLNSGVLDQPIYWSNNANTAMIGIIIAGGWTFWPFMFLVIHASRESIPDEYYESAQMYGASKIQAFRHVTYPQIKSAIMVAVAIRIVWNLAKVSQPLQMTQGGPGYSTSMLAVLLYRFAFIRGQLGLAYIVGIVLFLLSLVAVLIFIRSGEE